MKLKAVLIQLSGFAKNGLEATMRRRRTSSDRELNWDGRALFCPRFDASLPGGDSKLWMCAEDAGLELWSQFNRLSRSSDDQASAVDLRNCSEELRDILADSITRDHYGRSLHESVADFIKMVASHIVSTSEAHYEICGGWDEKTDPPRLECANLMFVAKDSIAGRGPWQCQIAETTTDDFEAETRIVRLNSARMIRFDAPIRYRRLLRRVRGGFRAIGKSEWEWRTNIDWNNVQEDFKKVSRSYSIQRARLCAPIGWNGRGEFHDYIADYHFFHRHLKWIRFCIMLRDELLSKLSDAFAIIGSLRGESPRLQWAHLPTLKDVEDAETLLKRGAQFDEITKAFK